MEQLRLSRETQGTLRRLTKAAEVIAHELKRYNDRQEETNDNEEA